MSEKAAQAIPISRNITYAHLAGFIIVYYDCLLNIDSEIKVIWKAEGVKMNVLYLLTRYLPLAYSPLFVCYHFNNNDHRESECSSLYEAFALLFTITALLAAFIVTIRTWAVWAKDKYMTCALFGLYTVGSALILGFVLISLKYTSHQAIFPLGCTAKYGSSYVPAAFVVGAAYDTVILALMLIRGVSLYQWVRDSRLFQTLYRDGIMFYIYITAVSLANAILLFKQSHYDVFLLPIQGAIRSVLACRIILHIRLQYDKLQMNNLPEIKRGHVAIHVERDVIELQDVGR